VNFEKLLTRYGWLIVMAAALSISAWSLWWIGIRLGLPPVLAGAVSACYDLGALVCAMLALNYARSQGDSGLGPRMGVFILGGISAYLNAQHAAMAGDHTLAAEILYACPPVISVAIFELQTRWLRRGALRRAGRIPERLPVFGRWAWILFPFRTLGTTRRIVSFRLDNIANRETGIIETRPAIQEIDSGGDYEQTEIRTTVIREWARTRGIQVNSRGPLPASLRSSYLAELNSGNSDETQAETSLTSGNGPEDVPLALPPVPGELGSVPAEIPQSDLNSLADSGEAARVSLLPEGDSES
jgi:hypothetical protein